MQASAGTVFVVEDDAPLRQTLLTLFESHGLCVCAYGMPSEFLRGYDQEQPGCLIFDLRLPEMSGLDLLEEVRARGDHHPLIMISGYESVESAVAAMRQGALDFIVKPIKSPRLLERVDQALALDVRLRRVRRRRLQIQGRIDSLTPRENQVMKFVARGLLSKEIAIELGISPKTVEVHRANLIRKMKARSVAHLVRMVSLVQDTHESLADVAEAADSN